MAFFDINDFKDTDDNTLSYNYGTSEIYSKTSNFNTNNDNESKGYYKCQYGSNNTRLTYNNVVYKPDNIYIYSVIHNNITGLTQGDGMNKNIVGELVIKQNATSGRTIYSCFFLEGSGSENTISDFTSSGSGKCGAGTSIDKIICMFDNNSIEANTQITSINTSLSSEIASLSTSNNKYIVYNDPYNSLIKIVIFFATIKVNSTSVKIIKNSLTKETDLFGISAPSDYKTNVATSSSKSSCKNNNNNNEIYIDCNPVGVDEKEISTYNIPINSGIMSQIQQNDVLKTASDFFLFIVVLAVIYVAVPRLYKSTVIDNANLVENVETNSDFFTNKQYNRLVRIASIDMLISAVFALIIFYFIAIKGIQYEKFEYLLYGIALLIFFGVSFILIQINKLDSKFMTTPGGKGISIYPDNFDNVIKEKNISLLNVKDIGVIGGNIAGYYSTAHPHQAFYYTIAVEVLAGILFLSLYLFSDSWNDDLKDTSIFVLCMIPIIIPLLVFIIKS